MFEDRLEIVIENVDKLSQEEFAMIRRNGLGASDSSVVLGTMDKFRTPEMLLEEKCSKVYTEAEAAIGDIVNVRKGRDLEPLIICKASEFLCVPIHKRTTMYRLKDFPFLTVNFDGLIDNTDIPVECKFISAYGAKYYDFTRAGQVNPTIASRDILALAKHHGVPPYYYVQVQHQLLFTGGDHGFLAALNDKDWTLYVFHIQADEYTQSQIKIEGYKFWQKRLKILG